MSCRADCRRQRGYESLPCRIALQRIIETDWTGPAIAGDGRQSGGRGTIAHNAVPLTGLLVRDEEEKLILLYWPAKRASKLIGIQYRLWQTLEIANPVVGVQRAVAEKFKRASVVVVGAGLSDYIDVGARVASVTRIVGRGLNLEFLDGIRNRNGKGSKLDALRARVETEPIVDGNAILQIGVLSGAASIYSNKSCTLARK